MIRKLFILFIIFLTLPLSVKPSTDEWTLYPSYKNATYCEIAKDKIYILASGALYSYNIDDNELRTYDKINILSDVDITHIAYSGLIDGLIIVYSNANIDILYDDETIYNISDFKNKSLPNKKINSVNIQNNKALFSTEFGIVVLNLEKLEFTNTYNTGLNTYSCCFFKEKIYAATDKGLYCCDTKNNPLDKANWSQINTTSTEVVCEFNNRLYCLVKDSGIYTYDPNTNNTTLIVNNNGEKYHTLYNNGNEMIAPAGKKTTIITGDNKFTTYSNNNNLHTAKKGNTYFDCKGYGGVVEYEIEENKIKTKKVIPQPDSPIRNYCEYMKTTPDGRLLVAGGNINYFGIVFYESTLMEYDPEKDRWFIFPEDTIKNVTKINHFNLCSIDEDPTQAGHYFASSFGYGIYEFQNGKFIKHYNHENSILESAVSGNSAYAYVRVPTVKFDSEGNLWCVNSDVKDVVKILKKDGSWTSLKYKNIEYLATAAKIHFDSRGWLWITGLQGTPGVFCANTKKTMFDISDDVTRFVADKFTNQDGVSYDIYQIYDISEDKNGDIWVGTNTGIFVIDNAEKFLSDGILKQIKIARNDGTGLADYFMSGEYIKDIEIDGANRKWIGTNDNGIYLVSADGKETIHHFTTENSPIPSNTIESIAINGITGEVFIGTNKGIASFMSDATEPEEILEKGNIHAYPNPVTSNHNGNISIVGLTADCNVKIVDTSGLLVNEGKSNGGMYTWNGRDKRGEKVTSGVYHVLTYDENGNEGATTRILITR